jgi:hypothetical protein
MRQQSPRVNVPACGANAAVRRARTRVRRRSSSSSGVSTPGQAASQRPSRGAHVRPVNQHTRAAAALLIAAQQSGVQRVEVAGRRRRRRSFSTLQTGGDAHKQSLQCALAERAASNCR